MEVGRTRLNPKTYFSGILIIGFTPQRGGQT
jgi:hypothetical protein